MIPNNDYTNRELQSLVNEIATFDCRSEAEIEDDIRYYARLVAEEDFNVDKAYRDAEQELGIRTEEQHFLFVDVVDAVLEGVNF